MIDIVLMCIFLFLDIIMIFCAFHLQRKIDTLIVKNRKEAIDYSKSVVIGVVSGFIVIVVDRIITIAFANGLSIDKSSLYNAILSIISVIIIGIFIATLIILAVYFLTYRGLSIIVKTK